MYLSRSRAILKAFNISQGTIIDAIGGNYWHLADNLFAADTYNTSQIGPLGGRNKAISSSTKRRDLSPIDSQFALDAADEPLVSQLGPALGMINLSKDLQAGNTNVLCTRKQREFIPDSRKDDTYWDRRRKNNEAAKRSREKRRISDLMLETRVLELTRENALLHAELYAIKEAFRLPQSQHFINPESIPVQVPDLTFRQRRASVRSLVGAETTSEAGSTSSSVISTSSSTSSLLNSLSGPAAAVAACLAASCQQQQSPNIINKSNAASPLQQQSLSSSSSSSSPPSSSQLSVQNHLSLHNNNNNNSSSSQHSDQSPNGFNQSQTPSQPHLQHLSELIAQGELNEFQFKLSHHNEILANQHQNHEMRVSTSNSSSCLPLKLRHKKQNPSSLYR